MTEPSRTLMNPTLAEMERTGLVELASGTRVKLHSQVGPALGRVLQHAVHSSAPRLGCEAGLAFGMSTLYILDQMLDIGAKINCAQLVALRKEANDDRRFEHFVAF